MKMAKKYKKIEKPLGRTKFIQFKLPEYLVNLKLNIVKYIGPKRINRMSRVLK